MTTDFPSWLHQQLVERNWSQTDLVNSANSRGYTLNSSQVSRILRHEQEGGVDAVIAIAHGLGISREEAFQARGWLLSEPAETSIPHLSADAWEVATEIDRLPLTARRIALHIVRATLEALRYDQ